MREPLEPQHPTMIGKRRAVRGLDSIIITHDQRVTVQGIALDVFTRCVNSGRTLQEALASIYLTGLQHGTSAEKEILNG